ncbi:Ig-like domain-containing protein [Corallococcus exiguus]|nr:Ig-like domain-containing protein [Corallococcus exiguus]NRD53918.1 Ig-like domain-containing protein [Corallococcus exiguus]NRD68151.1 Ig-like domain-containing protein [Corallococcus exiguus]
MFRLHRAVHRNGLQLWLVHPHGVLLPLRFSGGPVAPSDFVRDNLPRWAGQDATTRTLVARLLETWPTLADTRVLGNRSYSLALRATDNAGNVQTSTRNLIVDNQLPTSILTSPANGAVVSGNVTLTANASDTQAMLQVIFEIDGVATYFVEASPYTRTWNTAGLSGTHTIVAIASDRAGNSRRSNAVTVTVP